MALMMGSMETARPQRQQFITNTGNRSLSNTPLIENRSDSGQIVVPDRKSWKNLFAYMGPGFLVSIAYIDPGNFETDLQSGAQYKYELLWIILVASCAALIIQSLAANLGVVTGKHLAEHCRAEYPKVPNFILWVLAEISIVACDIPEVIGMAFALNMLFKIPVWIGVLLTGLSTLVLLALQQYGVRKLEFLIAFLVFTIATCFFAELGYAKPIASEVMKGLFVPQLNGNGATALAISLLGAMVMPHNLFLHSALVLSRKVPRSINGIQDACRFYAIESAFALMVAFLINLSIISVSGAVCNSSNLNLEDQMSCKDLDLNKASFLLRNVLGSWSSKLFAIALLASGQSSTITGTYAGQYVMQEYKKERGAGGGQCWPLANSDRHYSLNQLLGVTICCISFVSSKMPQDLPGFYYDPEKNSYFPIKGPIPSSPSSHSRRTPSSLKPEQGFLDLRLTPWIRNFLTRCLAIVPSLIVAIIGGSAGAGKLIIIASMILSFELPFALVPLLKFTSSKTKMGSYANSTLISAITWTIGSLIMAVNIYFLATSFVKFLVHSKLKLLVVVFVGIVGFLGILVYLAGIVYLVVRKNKEIIHILSSEEAEMGERVNISGNEPIYCLPREDIVSMQLPPQGRMLDSH